MTFPWDLPLIHHSVKPSVYNHDEQLEVEQLKYVIIIWICICILSIIFNTDPENPETENIKQAYNMNLTSAIWHVYYKLD